MIQAYMNVDLNNPLAVKYHQLSLKSFECVKDIFNINVLQCITPDTLLDISFSDKKKRSPQEESYNLFSVSIDRTNLTRREVVRYGTRRLSHSRERDNIPHDYVRLREDAYL